MATTTVNLGLSLDGLSNVDSTGKSTGDGLIWNGTTSNWEAVSITNVYNSDGTLTSVRIMTMDGNTFTFDGGLLDAVVKIQALNSASLDFVRGDGTKAWEIVKLPDGTENLRINRCDPTGAYLDTPIEINMGSGKVLFNGAYEFPNADGFSNQVLTTDGLGQLSFQDASSLPTSDGWITIVKGANQDVTNSTTLTDDTDLQFSVVAGGYYMVEMNLCWSGTNATVDYKFSFTPSAGTITGRGLITGYNTSVSPVIIAFQDGGTVQLGTVTNIDTLFHGKITFSFLASSNATVKYQFANNGATNATSRTWKGSILKYKRID
jgi:hypothetical protein